MTVRDPSWRSLATNLNKSTLANSCDCPSARKYTIRFLRWRHRRLVADLPFVIPRRLTRTIHLGEFFGFPYRTPLGEDSFKQRRCRFETAALLASDLSFVRNKTAGASMF